MVNAELDVVLADATLVALTYTSTLSASLDGTTADATLQALAWGTENAAVLDLIVEDAGLAARVVPIRTAQMRLTTGAAILTSTAHRGTAPVLPPQLTGGAQIYNVTGPVHATGGTILCFIGPPDRSVEWRLLQGQGTLTPFTTFTDAQGRCSCRFDAAGITGRVVIGAAWVP